MSEVPYKPAQIPTRPKNADVRAREWLHVHEVEKLMIAAAKHPTCGERNALMIRVAFRHALRVTELVNLEWDQIDFKRQTVLVKRVKNGDDSTHALQREEVVGLRRLLKNNPHNRFVFTSHRGQLSVDAVQKIVRIAGEDAKLGFPVHPHMLRHARGYDLANKGADTRGLQHLLGHKNIRHTVTYTKLADKTVLALSKL